MVLIRSRPFKSVLWYDAGDGCSLLLRPTRVRLNLRSQSFDVTDFAGDRGFKSVVAGFQTVGFDGEADGGPAVPSTPAESLALAVLAGDAAKAAELAELVLADAGRHPAKRPNALLAGWLAGSRLVRPVWADDLAARTERYLMRQPGDFCNYHHGLSPLLGSLVDGLDAPGLHEARKPDAGPPQQPTPNPKPDGDAFEPKAKDIPLGVPVPDGWSSGPDWDAVWKAAYDAGYKIGYEREKRAMEAVIGKTPGAPPFRWVAVSPGECVALAEGVDAVNLREKVPRSDNFDVVVLLPGQEPPAFSAVYYCLPGSTVIRGGLRVSNATTNPLRLAVAS